MPQSVVLLSQLQIAVIAGFRSVAQTCVFESVLRTEEGENHQCAFEERILST